MASLGWGTFFGAIGKYMDWLSPQAKARRRLKAVEDEIALLTYQPMTRQKQERMESLIKERDRLRRAVASIKD
jgi:hypothetical protein